LLELLARTARGLDLADRDHDLHERRKEPRALERQRGRRLRTADRGRGGVRASLREAQLSESGLRLPSKGARLSVRPLGCGELALQAEELALPVASEAGGRILRL